jgi:hypothetical protein
MALQIYFFISQHGRSVKEASKRLGWSGELTRVVTPLSSVEVRKVVSVPITTSEVSEPTLTGTPPIVTAGPPAVMVVAPTTICVATSVDVVRRVEGGGGFLGADEGAGVALVDGGEGAGVLVVGGGGA